MLDYVFTYRANKQQNLDPAAVLSFCQDTVVRTWKKYIGLDLTGFDLAFVEEYISKKLAPSTDTTSP